MTPTPTYPPTSAQGLLAALLDFEGEGQGGQVLPGLPVLDFIHHLLRGQVAVHGQGLQRRPTAGEERVGVQHGLGLAALQGPAHRLRGCGWGG